MERWSQIQWQKERYGKGKIQKRKEIETRIRQVKTTNMTYLAYFERERERERERKREREMKRRRQRETERQRQRERQRQTDRHRKREGGGEVKGGKGREAN